jgi:hypothetical protein
MGVVFSSMGFTYKEGGRREARLREAIYGQKQPTEGVEEAMMSSARMQGGEIPAEQVCALPSPPSERCWQVLESVILKDQDVKKHNRTIRCGVSLRLSSHAFSTDGLSGQPLRSTCLGSW